MYYVIEKIITDGSPSILRVLDIKSGEVRDLPEKYIIDLIASQELSGEHFYNIEIRNGKIEGKYYSLDSLVVKDVARYIVLEKIVDRSTKISCYVAATPYGRILISGKQALKDATEHQNVANAYINSKGVLTVLGAIQIEIDSAAAKRVTQASK